MAHVAKWKMNRVEHLTDILLKDPVIGIVDIEGIPASQLQLIRKGLPSGSNFIVTRNTLLKMALKKASEQKKNLEKLSASLDGQRGVITANINPFKLFRTMEATKIKAPAKGGEIAPEDIEIKEGDTPFKPGPIVGELQKAGFPAAIERGKVVIKKNKTLVKKGQRIPRDVAKLMARLEIYPMTVGLSLLIGFENGTVYERDVLNVDVAGYIKNMGTAGSQAFNLSMFINYPTKLTIRPLLQNAYQKAINLAFNAEIPTSISIVLLLGKAQSQALSLASHLPDLKVGEEKPKEEKAEKIAEEKKEEKIEEKDEKSAEEVKKEKIEENKLEKKEEEKKKEETPSSDGS
jgi:large subunit ribosomal protein L10